MSETEAAADAVEEEEFDADGESEDEKFGVDLAEEFDLETYEEATAAAKEQSRNFEKDVENMLGVTQLHANEQSTCAWATANLL